MQRYELGKGLQSWFKDDKLPTVAKVAGRLWGGIKAADMTDAEKAKFETSNRVQVGYDTTRPGFTYRKDVKELIRGGLESSHIVRDYDLKCSFPSVFLQRHPWAVHVRKWIDGSLMQMMPELEHSAAKMLINSAFGVGDHGVQGWCMTHNLRELPLALVSYLSEIRKGAQMDMRNHPD